MLCRVERWVRGRDQVHGEHIYYIFSNINSEVFNFYLSQVFIIFITKTVYNSYWLNIEFFWIILTTNEKDLQCERESVNVQE